MRAVLSHLRDILLDLRKWQEVAWDRPDKPSNRASETRQKLQSEGRAGLSQKQLEHFLGKGHRPPTKNMKPDWNRFIFLPPISRDEGFVPLLFLPPSFNTWNTQEYFYLVLYRFYTPLNKTPRLVACGFRFEGPHPVADAKTSKKVGRHEYYHVQLIRRRDKQTLEELPEWLPESIPALPCTANCLVSLLLCVLFSLYERHELEKSLPCIWRLPNKHLEPLPRVFVDGRGASSQGRLRRKRRK